MLPLTAVRRVGARVLLVTQAPPSLPASCLATEGACVSQALRALLCCAAVETSATVAACGGAQAALAAPGAEAQLVGSQFGVAADAGVLSAPLLLPVRPLHTPPVPGVHAPLSLFRAGARTGSAGRHAALCALGGPRHLGLMPASTHACPRA